MFTGIIEEVGLIDKKSTYSGGNVIFIEADKILSDITIGDSIAVNGACLSVTDYKKKGFEVQVSQETLDKTTLASLKRGDPVNLERPLKAEDRLDGHIVQGHVDDTGKIVGRYKQGDNYIFEINIPEHLVKYIVTKGSITIDGISLTVAEIEANTLKVAIIPITLKETNLHSLNRGDKVNIETDILARYMESIVESGSSDQDFKDKIKKWGY